MTRVTLRRLLVGTVLLAAWTTVGCSSAVLPGRSPALADDVAELKRRVLELQRQTTQREIEVERLRNRIAELEAALGTGTSSRRPAATEPPAPSRDDTPPVRATDQPILEEVDLPDEPDAPDEAPGPATSEAGPEREPVPVSDAGQAVYDRGYTLYHQGRYLDAESTFQRFLAEHGNTDLADNARYWIGEARYARGDLPGALAAFRETVQRHPTGNKVPDALLKAGQALEDLGDRESSREMYRELVRRFPASDAAAVAERRLNSMP